MGKESEQIFNTLQFGEMTVGDEVQQEVGTDFETLVWQFDKYFILKCNLIHERTKFQKIYQKILRLEEFCRCLSSLVEHCDYTDTDDQIRDRFVVGLRDWKRLKEKPNGTQTFSC